MCNARPPGGRQTEEGVGGDSTSINILHRFVGLCGAWCSVTWRRPPHFWLSSVLIFDVELRVYVCDASGGGKTPIFK